jgi:molecular chaperone Hsp33
MSINKKIVIANENTGGPMDDGNVAADHVQPFILDTSNLRGRMVRLPTVINDILTTHNYPEPVSRLLAEALCLTTLLAGMLKFDGIFTLQVKGSGPLTTMVCDMMSDGTLRGMASFDAEAVAALEDDADFLTLTVNGYLAFTVDQANSTDRYQGITELKGVSLTESVRFYFQQSEQIQTAFVTQIDLKENVWNGAAMMLQQMGLETGTHEAAVSADEKTEHWRRSMMLMGTLKPQELLDDTKPLNTILYQLFHEEGVRVFLPIEIKKGCRCSFEKICTVLEPMPQLEKDELAVNGIISVTCEFCNTTYDFPVT